METFITKIYVKESRGGVRDLEIPLSEIQRQHLIITGKNGSGKTGLLENIKDCLSIVIERELITTPNRKLNVYFGEDSMTNFEKIIHSYQAGRFILAYFGAKRTTTNENIYIPTGIEKIELQQSYSLDDQANIDFIQYIVNLKADRSFAKDDEELDAVKKIDKWFNRFEHQLKEIFDEPSLKLIFDRKKYNFSIQMDGKEPFGFDTLSDGYSAIISIVTELLLRMEHYNSKAYDMEGIVLIDEIETHLHVELQKRVLPFLIAFFPKIQFIVTTHSPFVIQSVANTTICDLEYKIVTNDLSAYSYDALLESYFMTDKYSDVVKEKIAEYENLVDKENKTIEDKENIKLLKDYFAHVPKYLSKELNVKLQQIELKELTR